MGRALHGRKTGSEGSGQKEGGSRGWEEKSPKEPIPEGLGAQT